MREWLKKRGVLLSALAPVIGVGLAVSQVMVGAQGDQAETVLKAMREALGGEQKISALKGLTAEGGYRRTMGEREISGDLEVTLQFPDKFAQAEQFTLPTGMPGPRITRVFNGTEGWIDAPAGGFRMGPGGGGMNVMVMGAPGGGPGAPPPPPPAGGGQAAPAGQGQAGQGQGGPGGPGGPGGRRGDPTPMVRAEFYRAVLGILPVAQTTGLTFTHAGQADSNDGVAEVLDVKAADGFAARLFVDGKTHLPVMLTYMAPQPRVFTRRPDDTPETIRQRFEAERGKPPQMVEHTVFFSDHKKVNGVMLPHRLTRAVDGKTTEEIEIKAYKANPTIDQKTFEKKSSN
jgi:hypothetical protein